MKPRGDRSQRIRKRAIVALTAATGLVCGWSALGASGAVAFAIAAGTSAAVAVFHDESQPCLPRRRRPRKQ